MSDERRFYETSATGAARSAPAALRNREPIAEVLREWLPTSGLVLEVASGTGEHAVYFADTTSGLEFEILLHENSTSFDVIYGTSAGVNANGASATSGVQLALVTSDSEANARAKLGDAAGLFSHFDCAASLFGKPAKFRRVIRRAGVPPAQVIAIGDEVRDIEAARAAGVACGAVCWGYAAPAALRASRPDFVFARIDDIAPALLTGAADLRDPALLGPY